MMLGVQERMSRVTNHPFIEKVTHGVSSFVSTIEAVTSSVANSIFVQILISLPLVYLHHNLFTIGFAIGFVCHKLVRQVVVQIEVVKNAERTPLQKVRFFVVVGTIAVVLMANVLIIASIYHSTFWGSYFYRSCLKENQEANDQFPAKKVDL